MAPLIASLIVVFLSVCLLLPLKSISVMTEALGVGLSWLLLISLFFVLRRKLKRGTAPVPFPPVLAGSIAIASLTVGVTAYEERSEIRAMKRDFAKVRPWRRDVFSGLMRGEIPEQNPPAGLGPYGSFVVELTTLDLESERKIAGLGKVSVEDPDGFLKAVPDRQSLDRQVALRVEEKEIRQFAFDQRAARVAGCENFFSNSQYTARNAFCRGMKKTDAVWRLKLDATLAYVDAEVALLKHVAALPRYGGSPQAGFDSNTWAGAYDRQIEVINRAAEVLDRIGARHYQRLNDATDQLNKPVS